MACPPVFFQVATLVTLLNILPPSSKWWSAWNFCYWNHSTQEDHELHVIELFEGCVLAPVQTCLVNMNCLKCTLHLPRWQWHMQWLLMFCSSLSIHFFASLPCAECLKTWPRWTVLPQSVSSCNVSTSASIYPCVGKGRNARGDQSELPVELKSIIIGIVHIWLSDYKKISITYALSFGDLKFTHIWTEYTWIYLWFWSSLKNNLKVQNNNFLRNNHHSCIWFLLK